MLIMAIPQFLRFFFFCKLVVHFKWNGIVQTILISSYLTAHFSTSFLLRLWTFGVFLGADIFVFLNHFLQIHFSSWSWFSLMVIFNTSSFYHILLVFSTLLAFLFNAINNHPYEHEFSVYLYSIYVLEIVTAMMTCNILDSSMWYQIKVLKFLVFWEFMKLNVIYN